MDDTGFSRLYHLALRGEWLEAVDAGTAYERSTLGASLADVGFIHCSFADQVQATADLVYRGRADVVLLEIDPARVEAEVRVESLGGGTFPHIYGPLPIRAVLTATDVRLGPDGRLLTEIALGHS